MKSVAAMAASPKKQITKKRTEDLFVEASWIYHILDNTNQKALRVKQWAQQHLDPQWCVRASHQIRDLDLRHRWLQAKHDQLDPNNSDPPSLPRVVPAVRRHMEREFEKTYPKGVCDPEIGTS